MREEPLVLNKGSHSNYSNEDAEIMSDFTVATESRRHSDGNRPFHIVTEKDRPVAGGEARGLEPPPPQKFLDLN